MNGQSYGGLETFHLWGKSGRVENNLSRARLRKRFRTLSRLNNEDFASPTKMWQKCYISARLGAYQEVSGRGITH